MLQRIMLGMTVVAVVTAIIIASAAISNATKYSRHLREQQAEICAIESEGTDQAIVDCYRKMALPCPEDLCNP